MKAVPSEFICPLGTYLYDRQDISTLAELYYFFGCASMYRNQGIGGSGSSHRSGPYSIVVAPKYFQEPDNGAVYGALNYMNVNTLVIPSMTTGYQYFSRGLVATNLIMLCDKPTAPNNSYARFDRSVTNFYVPDDKVSSYSGWGALTPKPLSQFLESNSPYVNMVRTLYQKGILVRDWL